MLEQPLEQFGDSNVALLPSYSCGKVVIVDQLGRDAVGITPLARQHLMEGLTCPLESTNFPLAQAQLG